MRTEKIARRRKIIPGKIIFRCANPDIEVGIDPRTRDDGSQLLRGRLAPNGLRDGQALKSAVMQDAIIEPPQKFSSGFWIRLPGILSIQDDWHHCVSSLLQHRSTGGLNATEKIARRIACGHSGINKANKVGERMVAEDHMHGRSTLLPAINAIQLFRGGGL